MDKEINKIIIIIGNPFSQRDYDRFGIEILRNRGFEVEIWDISPFLLRKCQDSCTNDESTTKFKDLRVFREKSEIVNGIVSLDERCLVNCFIEYSMRTFFIFRLISKYNIRYCVFGMVSFPSPYPPDDTPFRRLVSLLKNINLLKVEQIAEHICNKILLKYYFVFGVAPASIILLSGEKSSGSFSYPVNYSTTRLWTHMLDYDIYLNEKTERSDSGNNTGVFLDQYLPHHPDFIRLGVEFPVSPQNYYPNICIFFKILEQKMNHEIVIAAHPRSDYENSPDYFCGRTIIKGETAKLVRESSFVIAHTSTSINYAVLYRKPILFITTDELEKMTTGKNLTGLYIPAISSVLGKSPINIDHLSGFDWDKEMAINEEAYVNYKNQYIKKQGTPEKPHWEIFSSFLRKDHISG